MRKVYLLLSIVLFFQFIPLVFAANGTLVWGSAANGVLNTSAYAYPYTIGASYNMDAFSSASGITFARIEAFYTRNEYFVAHQNQLGHLNVLSCTKGCDNPGDWKLIGNFSGMAASSLSGNRSFDIAIEETGDALVVFGNRTQLNETYYCIWNGTAWSPTANCGSTFAPGAGNRIRTQVGIPKWVTLTARGNEILGAVSGTGGLAGIYWNGTEWNNTGNVTIMQHPVATNPMPGFGIAWENRSGNGFVMYDSTAADGTTFYTIFNATTKRWGNATTLPLAGNASGPSLGTDNGNWINIASDPNSSRIAIEVLDSGSDAHVYIWKGNDDTIGFTTTGTNPIDAAIEATTGKAGTVTWTKNSSLAMFSYTDASVLTQDVLCWNRSNGFSATITADVGGSGEDDTSQVIAVRSHDNNESFILRGDITEGLIANIWNGTSCAINQFTKLPTAGVIESSLPIATDNTPPIEFDFGYQRFIARHEAPRPNTTTIAVNESVNFFPNRFYFFNTSWSDTEDLTNYYFSINQTNGFVNQTSISFNGTTNISNVTFRVRTPGGFTTQWFFYANDTEWMANGTTVQTFAVTALNFSANASYVGTPSISTGQSIALVGNCTCLPLTETCSGTNISIFDNRTGVMALSSLSTADVVYVNVTNYFIGDLVGRSAPFLFNITVNTAGNYNFSILCNSTDGLVTNTTSKQTAALVAAVSDVAPVVTAVSPITSQTITEATTTPVVIRFNVTDSNGFGNIDNASAEIRVNISNDVEYIRFNTTCENETVFSTDTIQFKCTAPMWYFDSPGNWTINASARDLANLYAENRTTSFELQQTTALQIGPAALTWATLELGQLNRTSNSDPIIVNNTGNKNITVGGLTVAGKDLRGLTILAEHIGVANFSVASASTGCTQGGACAECNGTMLFNGTSGSSGAKPIINTNMTRGNNSLNMINGTSGQEDLYFCLVNLATEISRQTYDTSNYGSWIISIS